MADRAGYEKFINSMADRFFQEVVAADDEWTDMLAKEVGDGAKSQSVFYQGPPEQDGDVYDAYAAWVQTLDDSDNRRLAWALADQVLFEVSKNIGTFEKVSSSVSVAIDEVSSATAFSIADVYGASKFANLSGKTTFYFDDVDKAVLCAEDMGGIEDISQSHRVKFRHQS